MSRTIICDVVGGVDADDAVARRLRLWADDAELLADDAIEERGFPGVGFSDDGDDSGAGHGGKIAGAARCRNDRTPGPGSEDTRAFEGGAGDGLLSRALASGVPSAL